MTIRDSSRITSARASRSVLALGLLAACSGGDPLEDDDVIAGWANASSAMGAYEVAREPVAFADGKHQYDDPACPLTSNDGTMATVSGGCTDSKGRVWTGTATVVRGGGGAKMVTFEEFGNDGFGGASKTSGTVAVAELAADRHTFEVDTVMRGGITTDVRYSGSVVGTYDTAATTWNGSGTISRDGDFYKGGTVEAVTVDQVRDDACPGEGFSGTTTVTSDEHVVVITYDGATACDPDHSARWSRDGKDRGLVTGVTCNSAGGSSGAAIVLAAIALIGRRRHRRQPDREVVGSPVVR